MLKSGLLDAALFAAERYGLVKEHLLQPPGPAQRQPPRHLMRRGASHRRYKHKQRSSEVVWDRYLGKRGHCVTCTGERRWRVAGFGTAAALRLLRGQRLKPAPACLLIDLTSRPCLVFRGASARLEECFRLVSDPGVWAGRELPRWCSLRLFEGGAFPRGLLGGGFVEFIGDDTMIVWGSELGALLRSVSVEGVRGEVRPGRSVFKALLVGQPQQVDKLVARCKHLGEFQVDTSLQSLATASLCRWMSDTPPRERWEALRQLRHRGAVQVPAGQCAQAVQAFSQRCGADAAWRLSSALSPALPTAAEVLAKRCMSSGASEEPWRVVGSATHLWGVLRRCVESPGGWDEWREELTSLQRTLVPVTFRAKGRSVASLSSDSRASRKQHGRFPGALLCVSVGGGRRAVVGWVEPRATNADERSCGVMSIAGLARALVVAAKGRSARGGGDAVAIDPRGATECEGVVEADVVSGGGMGDRRVCLSVLGRLRMDTHMD
jgi:hypothetical protein